MTIFIISNRIKETNHWELKRKHWSDQRYMINAVYLVIGFICITYKMYNVCDRYIIYSSIILSRFFVLLWAVEIKGKIFDQQENCQLGAGNLLSNYWKIKFYLRPHSYTWECEEWTWEKRVKIQDRIIFMQHWGLRNARMPMKRKGVRSNSFPCNSNKCFCKIFTFHRQQCRMRF